MQLHIIISYDTEGNWKLYVVDTEEYLEYGTLVENSIIVRSVRLALQLPTPIAPLAVVSVPNYVGGDNVAATVTIE